MPQILIDERLFAHIQNDAFLTGSYNLTGNLFINTIGYLNQYLEKHPIDSPSIKQLQLATTTLCVVEQQLITINQSQNSQQLFDLAQKLVESTCSLTSGSYLLLPGGWRSESGGHAIIYQFIKEEQGSLLFTINNSGSGLNFHEKKSSAEKELYNPVLTYRIPQASLQKKETFAHILKSILELQVPALHKKKKLEAEDLYEDCFQLLSHLDTELVISKEVNPEYWYTAGQLSGTCTQRSLHQMLKVRFDTVDNYRRFIYHLNVCFE